MAGSFADDLRLGYLEVEACLSAEERAHVARARDVREVNAVERNRLLAAILCRYRAGDRNVWGPVVLDLLAPTLIVILQGLRPRPPVIDEDELRQQLVFEALRVAAAVPLLSDGRQTRFRIASRTYTGMLRWLRREARRQAWQLPLEQARPAATTRPGRPLSIKSMRRSNGFA